MYNLKMMVITAIFLSLILGCSTEQGDSSTNNTSKTINNNEKETPTTDKGGVDNSDTILVGTYSQEQYNNITTYTFNSDGTYIMKKTLDPNNSETGTFTYSTKSGLVLKSTKSFKLVDTVTHNTTYNYPDAVVYDNGKRLSLYAGRVVSGNAGNLVADYKSEQKHDLVQYTGSNYNHTNTTEVTTTYTIAKDGTISGNITSNTTNDSGIFAPISNSSPYTGSWKKIDNEQYQTDIGGTSSVFVPLWIKRGDNIYLVSYDTDFKRE